MQNVVIAGASGVVGSRVLTQLLGRGDVGRVVALGRRTLPLEHHKLASRVVDLQSTPALSGEMPDGVAVALCCLGTTMKQAGSRAAFRAVDRDAVLAFARAARQKGAARFVLTSSLGADPRARSFYLRTKGETEAAVAELGYPQLTVVRPSFIDDEHARTEFRLGERIALPLARAVFSLVGETSRYAPIRANTIALAIVHLAFDETTERIRTVESDTLHALGSRPA